MKYEQSTVEAARTVHTQRSGLRSPRMRLFSLLCVAGASAGCASADGDVEQMLVDVEDERALRVTWEEYLGHAIPSGNGQLIAEGDLVFEGEAELRAHYDSMLSSEEESKLAVIQRLSDGMEPTFTQSEQTNLTYCVSNTFLANKSAVTSDLQAAMRDWEAIARLRFVYVSSQDATCTQTNTNVQFAVMPTTDGLMGCGANKKMWAEVLTRWGCRTAPVEPVIRGVLLLNVNVTPLAIRVGVFRHELGHVLGFRHEFPWSPTPVCTSEPATEPTTGLSGRRLTPFDITSVMNLPECGGNSNPVISQRDGEGTREIYGMPASWYVPLAYE